MNDVKIEVGEDDNVYVDSRAMIKWMECVRQEEIRKKEESRKKEIEFEKIPLEILQSLGFTDIVSDRADEVDASIKGFRFFRIKLKVTSSVEDFLKDNEINLTVSYENKVKL